MLGQNGNRRQCFSPPFIDLTFNLTGTQLYSLLNDKAQDKNSDSYHAKYEYDKWSREVAT